MKLHRIKKFGLGANNLALVKNLASVICAGYGAYFLIHYDEFFSYQNLLPTSAAYLVVVSQAVLGLSLFFNIFPRVSALFLFVNLCLILKMNPLLNNVSFPYLSWVLIVLAVARDKDMKNICALTCILLAVTYTFSAYSKFIHSSWQTGLIIQNILSSPMSRSFPFKDLLRDNFFLCRFFSYAVILAEFSAILLLIPGKARRVGNIALTGLQFGLFLIMRIPAMSLTLLAVQYLAYDAKTSGRRG
jgi:hypothetical protein